MTSFRFSLNNATTKDIAKHLELCANSFEPPLHSYIDIYNYAKKLRDKAETFELWQDENLIGLIACYLNDYSTMVGFISNVSILPNYQGQNIASSLLTYTKDYTKEKGFNKLSLEVKKENIKAKKFYLKHSFVINHEKSTFTNIWMDFNLF